MVPRRAVGALYANTAHPEFPRCGDARSSGGPSRTGTPTATSSAVISAARSPAAAGRPLSHMPSSVMYRDRGGPYGTVAAPPKGSRELWRDKHCGRACPKLGLHPRASVSGMRVDERGSARHHPPRLSGGGARAAGGEMGRAARRQKLESREAVVAIYWRAAGDRGWIPCASFSANASGTSYRALTASSTRRSS